MKKMKVCFIGVGSIAKRHIRNWFMLCQKKGIVCEIDIYRSGKGNELENDIIEIIQSTYYAIDDMPDDYDVAFITNPTKWHLQTLKMFINKANHFFIEKPVSDIGDVEEIKNLEIPKEKVVYVACPLRYTEVIQYVKNNLNIEDVYSVRCISSSYLPEWRAGVDYRDTYSAHKDMGGGVSVDLIHEWDYLRYIFGMPKDVKKYITKVSNLEIDSDDLAIYIASYENRVLELHLDYFGKKTIREMCLFMADDTISCDLVESKITYLKSGKVIHFGEERNAFQMKELEYFLRIINGEVQNSNRMQDAYETMKLTQGEI